MALSSGETTLSPASTKLLRTINSKLDAIGDCPADEQGAVALAASITLLRDAAQLPVDDARAVLHAIKELAAEYLSRID